MENGGGVGVLDLNLKGRIAIVRIECTFRRVANEEHAVMRPALAEAVYVIIEDGLAGLGFDPHESSLAGGGLLEELGRHRSGFRRPVKRVASRCARR